MTAPAVLVALTLLAASLLVGGVLLIARRVRLSGLLLALGGSTLAASALAAAAGGYELAGFGFTTSGALLLPLALTTYPRGEWRHPVDFVALTTIGGAGALATSQWSASEVVGALGLVIGLALIAHTWWRIERSSASAGRWCGCLSGWASRR